MRIMQPLTEEQANTVYDILVTNAGASESQRDQFIFLQTTGVCDEYRFQGSLGFGGKFWRSHGRRPDGFYGEMWFVNYYLEDESHTRRMQVKRTNDRLWQAQQIWDEE